MTLNDLLTQISRVHHYSTINISNTANTVLYIYYKQKAQYVDWDSLTFGYLI